MPLFFILYIVYKRVLPPLCVRYIVETMYLLSIEKEKYHTEPAKGWRPLRAPVRRPNPLHSVFAWSVGIGIALLFLLFVLYAYLVHHH